MVWVGCALNYRCVGRPVVCKGRLWAILPWNPPTSLSRFTASVTTQAERKPVMTTAYAAANDVVDADDLNNDKRKSV